MANKLEQLYEDQTIICKGLNLLKVYVNSGEIGELLTKEQQERLFKLSVIEMSKLVTLEMELERGKKL